jgi:chromosome segregation ATPase
VEVQRITSNAQIEGLDGQIKGLTADNGALKGQLAAANGQIEGLAADNAALNGRIEGLTADNAALNGRIEGLVVQVEELSANVQSLRFENAWLDAENSNLAFHVIESRSELRESIMQARDAEAERLRFGAEMDIRVLNLELALIDSLERVRELEGNFA